MMTTTLCPVLNALRTAAAAVLANDLDAMAVAWCELEALADEAEASGESARVVRMMRGLERRLERANAA